MKRIFEKQSYYHIYNRGALKQVIFHDDKDRARFTFLLLTLQYNIQLKNISRIIKEGTVEEITLYLESISDKLTPENRFVEVIAFCLMPNHFHNALKELQEGGVTKYMQRLLTSYSKYFNKKYSKSGHVFQGPYKMKYVLDEPQLYYLSAYIHNNPKELGEIPQEYTWSSFSDYTQTNRWGKHLSTKVIMDAHDNDPTKYLDFVIHSGAKNN